MKAAACTEEGEATYVSIQSSTIKSGGGRAEGEECEEAAGTTKIVLFLIPRKVK
jgi:hypothetical protein